MKSPKTRFAAILLAALLLSPAAFAADTPPLAKADIERIIHDYIQLHPGEILDAVQSYQEKTARGDQVEAVKSNRAQIYDDALTPTAGPDDADVTLVEFFDYNCGYCKKVMPQIIELMEGDKKLRVLFKDFPILGASSDAAAKWALAALKQKKYFEFHKVMMQNRSPITNDLLVKVAKDVGMDVEKARTDIQGTEILLQLQRNHDLAVNMGIHGTPAFIVGDDLAPGAIGTDDLKKLIAKARAAKAQAK